MHNLLTERYKILYELAKVTIDIFRNSPDDHSYEMQMNSYFYLLKCIKGDDKFHDHIIIRSHKGKIIQLTAPVARRTEYLSNYDNLEKSFDICANYVKRSIYIEIEDENGYQKHTVNDVPEINRSDMEEYLFQQSLVEDMFDYKLLVAYIEPLLKDCEEIYFQDGTWDSTDQELNELLTALKEKQYEFIV